MASRRGRGDGDRGVAVVEFALVLPVLMMLLLGMVSGATAWNQSQSLGSGVRVGGRFAATLPADPAVMASWFDDVEARAVGATEGAFGTGVAGRSICIAFVDPAGPQPDKTVSRRRTGTATPVSGTAPCFEDGQGETGRRVQVVLQRTGFLDIGFYRQPLQIRREVVYRYEADSGF